MYIGSVRGTANYDNGDRANGAAKPGTLVTVEASSNPVVLLPAVMAHPRKCERSMNDSPDDIRTEEEDEMPKCDAPGRSGRGDAPALRTAW